jgi:sugar transferase (PEP-CTERM/EpsH1 system associated)
MKVLFVCHRVPYPPKRGGKIRPFNIIRHLTESGHEVTVASLARSEEERDGAKDLERYCAKVLVEVVPNGAAWARMIARLATGEPSSFGYFHSPRLARRIRAEASAARPELIFAHCSSVAPYVSRLAAPLKVLDFGDMDSQKWREYARSRALPLCLGYALEAVKLERAERTLAGRFDLCTCTTAAELASLKSLGVRTSSDWFPNGVDCEFFQPTQAPYDRELIAFVGRMDYYPNQQAVFGFCRDVLPGLRARRPELHLQIIGADPPRSVRALERLAGVSVTGSVADVRPYVTRAALTVAPLEIARGTQNKILESLAMGVPVVCSEQAAGGVDVVPGTHLLTARTSEEYADAVLSLLESPERRRSLAEAGRARVLVNHSWTGSMRRLDELLARARGARERAMPEEAVLPRPAT